MLSEKSINTIKLGDMIQFESPARQNHRILWRMVTGWREGNPTVRFYGQPKFVVKLEAVLAVKS